MAAVRAALQSRLHSLESELHQARGRQPATLTGNDVHELN